MAAIDDIENKETRENTKSPKSKRAEGHSESAQPNLTRRKLLQSVGLAGAAAVSAGSAHHLIAADTPAPPSSAVNSSTQSIPAREALEVLTAAEVVTLEAICDCLIPSDADGPGAREARAVHYIDRSLASHNLADRQSYLIGLNRINEYALQTRRKPYHELNRDQQKSILQAMQNNILDGFIPSSAGFFNMLRNHTIDGTFCDPYYGGNRNFIGWDMLRYPGVRLGVSADDVALGANLPANHQSAYDHATYLKTADYMGGDDHA